MKANLLVLEMDFDLILRMDWLVASHAIVDCFEKIVKFQIPSQLKFSIVGSDLNFCMLSDPLGRVVKDT